MTAGQVDSGMDKAHDAPGDQSAIGGVNPAPWAGCEDRTTEYKSSFRWDYARSQVNRDLQTVISKTAAAFLNSDGGRIFIGISDDKRVLGIENDIASMNRKTQDGFELALRTSLSNQLGADVSPSINVHFVEYEGRIVCTVECKRHPAPVYLRDGDSVTFFVRDGNRTVPLDTRTAHSYIEQQWRPQELDAAALANQIADTIFSRMQGRDQPLLAQTPGAATPIDPVPPWLTVGTRRVLNLFLSALSQASSWSRIFIISPWLSEFDVGATLSFDQFLTRLAGDASTAYVVTRPPTDAWHREAVARMGASGRANVVLVPELHAKLYIAETRTGRFALLGSANFTQQSLTNREVGLLINEFADGHRVIRKLAYEAGDIYRSANREVVYRASLGRTT